MPLHSARVFQDQGDEPDGAERGEQDLGAREFDGGFPADAAANHASPFTEASYTKYLTVLKEHSGMLRPPPAFARARPAALFRLARFRLAMDTSRRPGPCRRLVFMEPGLQAMISRRGFGSISPENRSMRMTKASERVLSGFVVENATSDDDMVAIVIRGSAASRRFSRAGKSGSALTADRGGPRPTFPRPATAHPRRAVRRRVAPRAGRTTRLDDVVHPSRSRLAADSWRLLAGGLKRSARAPGQEAFPGYAPFARRAPDIPSKNALAIFSMEYCDAESPQFSAIFDNRDSSLSRSITT